MTTTTTKIKKKTYPLDKGKLLSANALGLFNQALSGLDESSAILYEHATNVESTAAEIIAHAQRQADQLLKEAKEARAGVEANMVVRAKIQDLIS